MFGVALRIALKTVLRVMITLVAIFVSVPNGLVVARARMLGMFAWRVQGSIGGNTVGRSSAVTVTSEEAWRIAQSSRRLVLAREQRSADEWCGSPNSDGVAILWRAHGAALCLCQLLKFTVSLVPAWSTEGEFLKRQVIVGHRFAYEFWY